IDGYGNKFKKSTPEESSKDVMAVYNELKRNPNIDLDRVFLMTWSGGSAVVNRMVESYPKLWKGVIVFSGSPSLPESPSDNLKYLLFVGKRDTPFIKPNKEFQIKATKKNLPAKLLLAPRTGHEITNTDFDKKLGAEIAEFIFEKPYSKLIPDFGVEIIGH
ncbi:MAG: alpha/beta hydrolase family protein, partial [Limisphaerales bacterium]